METMTGGAPLNLSVLGTMLGIAFIMVGIGIVYAYRRILPYQKDSENQPHQPPDMLINIFGNFMRASYACLIVGVLLIVLANVLGPGLPLSGLTIERIPASLYYAAALGLLLVILTYNVLHYRVKAAISSDEDDNTNADRIARVHANFTEYVPTGLALLIALDWSGAPNLMVHVGGAIFTISRFLHAWGYTRNPFASFGRVVGIQGTLLGLSYMAVTALYYMLLAA